MSKIFNNVLIKSSYVMSSNRDNIYRILKNRCLIGSQTRLSSSRINLLNQRRILHLTGMVLFYNNNLFNRRTHFVNRLKRCHLQHHLRHRPHQHHLRHRPHHHLLLSLVCLSANTSAAVPCVIRYTGLRPVST